MAQKPAGKKRKYTAPKKPNGKLDVGRPQLPPIDLKKLTNLARVLRTDRELAIALGISYASFRDQKKENPAIKEALLDGAATFTGGLRTKQADIAMKGNVSMLKWLGIQYLGQKDKIMHASDPDDPLPAAVQQKITYATVEEAAAAFDARLKKHKG